MLPCCCPVVPQVEKLHLELQQSRDDLSRRINMATDTADAMLHSAAGASSTGCNLGGLACM